MKKNILYLFAIFNCLISCGSDDTTENPSTNDIPIESSKPNIVLIIADDMGLDPTPRYSIGNTKAYMPNLQQMMDTGILFNNLWSNPTCTPTRASIITGKYGFRTNVLKVGDELPLTETTLQKYLDNHSSGYQHAVIGKWHLSSNEQHPNIMGINHYAGITSGGVQSYNQWVLNTNGITSNATTYTTTAFTNLAIDWVANQNQPWFLWLAYNAPHTPFHLPPSELHHQGNLPDDQASIDANPLPYYLAMLEAMDTEIGRFINSLDQNDKENTVFIFIGDNGTPNQVVQEYPSRRAKGSLYQGGINVPMIISGKGVNRFNTTENALINTTDLFATIADIAGTLTSSIHDSHSLTSLFSNSGITIRDYAYAENESDLGEKSYTIRNTTHKYMLFEDGSEALYKLSENALENPNLLNSNQLPLSTEDEAAKNELQAKLNELTQ
ncbi:sulfatase-like hydrolase/transferase [Aquimarina rhabdastrellae]